MRTHIQQYTNTYTAEGGHIYSSGTHILVYVHENIIGTYTVLGGHIYRRRHIQQYRALALYYYIQQYEDAYNSRTQNIVVQSFFFTGDFFFFNRGGAFCAADTLLLWYDAPLGRKLGGLSIGRAPGYRPASYIISQSHVRYSSTTRLCAGSMKAS